MKEITINQLIIGLENLQNLDYTQPLNQACIAVENLAKQKCPVDKGDLRNSITHEVNGNVGVVGSNKEYAPYVEFGTGLFAVEGNGRQDRWCYQDAEGNWHSTIGQHPQPYLQPALLESPQKIEEIFMRFIEKEGLKNV